jgi:predicted nucleic acid-binding protein
MALVVSDTSPIRALDFLGQLQLLSLIYQTVYLPPSVAAELANPTPRFKSIHVGQLSSFVVRAPSNLQRTALLRTQLDAGEADAIALAEELSLDLLIDEKAGRSIAMNLGIRVTGVIGLLVEAKSAGWVPAVMPLLERLQQDLGFFIAPRLLEQIRVRCGE